MALAYLLALLFIGSVLLECLPAKCLCH